MIDDDEFIDPELFEEMCRRMPEKIKMMSAHNRGVTNSLESSMDPSEFISCWGAIDDIVGALADEYYDEDGMERDGVMRLLPEDLRDAYPDHFRQITTALDSLVSADPLPRVVYEDREPAKALNAAIVTTVATHIPCLSPEAKILVLCAGNGEDLNRISYSSGVLKMPHIDMVGYTDLNKRATEVLKTAKGYRATRSYLHDLPPGWLSTYDLILCHHGVHHLVRSAKGEKAFTDLLHHHLNPGGVFVGDFINIVGAKFNMEVQASIGSNVRLLRHSPSPRPNSLEGIMDIQVGNVVWQDPCLSYQRLSGLIPGGLKFDIATGRDYFKSEPSRPRMSINHRLIRVPKPVERAAHRTEAQMVSVLEVYRPPNIELYLPRQVFTPIGTYHNPVTYKWQLRTEIDATVAACFRYDSFKGRLVSKRDLYFMVNEPQLYSEKTNGTAAKVLIRGSGMWALVGDGRLYYHEGISRGVGIMYDISLAAECIDTAEGVKFVVLDPLHMGPHTPKTFAARLRIWLDTWLRNASFQCALEQKPWYDEWPGEICAKENWEGVVVMSPTTFTTFSSGPIPAKQARYVKRVITEDIEQDGKIVEVNYLTREYIRDRPDRNKPNTAEDVDLMRKAVPFQVIDLIMSVSPVWDEPGVISFLQWVRAKLPLKENPSVLAGISVLRRQWEGCPDFVRQCGLEQEWYQSVARPLSLCEQAGESIRPHELGPGMDNPLF